MLITSRIRALKFLCIALLAGLFANDTAAQCSPQSSVSFFYPNITNVRCAGTNALVDGYIIPSNYFRPPYSSAVIAPTAGSTATVSISGDSILYHNLLLNSSTSPNTDTRIIFSDSCGMRDTLLITFYAPPNELPFLESNGSYSLCDSSYRLGVNATGLNSFQLLGFNEVTSTYDTLSPSSVTVSSDSLVVKGIRPGYYLIFYKDSCGNELSTSHDGNLYNYNYYPYGGASVCNVNGLLFTFKPNLDGPFTYLSYTTTGTITAVPAVTTAGDSIVISNAIPSISYTFTLLDGCNDTFAVNYYALDTSQTAFTPVFNTKNCTTYSLYVKTTGGPFYDVQIESGLVAPGMGYVYYPDSLVITGLPLDSMYNNFIISFRDTACHNRRYVGYYLGQEQFSTGAATNWHRVDSCGSGFNLQTSRLLGAAPYSAFTWLNAPNTPTITFNGDIITLKNGIQLLNQNVETFYRFAMTDACGKRDTFTISSSYFNGLVNIYPQLISSTGGCQGANNGTAKIRFAAGTQNPLPYSNITVSGPAGASYSFAYDTLLLTGLIPDSSYTIRFRDACGHTFQYFYVASSSNIPMAISLIPSIEGICLKTLDSSFKLAITVANANYPYKAYLSGPVADTITNLNASQFSFSNLPSGTYQIKVEDMCNNIQTLAYTILSPGPLTAVNFATFDHYKGCDSFVYRYNKYYNISSLPYSYVRNLKFKGPYTAYVVRSNDTFWSYNTNNADTTNIQASFTFPSLPYSNVLEYMHVIDGCQDTAIVSVQAPYYYLVPTYICDSGVLTATYPDLSFSGNYGYNFPLRLTYINGNLQDTSAIIFTHANQLHTFKFKVGEYGCYKITDTCNIFINNWCFSGPAALVGASNTKICSPRTGGPNKGNVVIYAYNTNGIDSIKFHQISGPTILPDVITPSGYYRFNNIDTGTYKMVASEVNSCGRRDTFTVRVEPFLDSLSVVVVPGCLNANKMVFYYYNNYGSSDYHNVVANTNLPFSFHNISYSYSISNVLAGDTLYNLPSDMDIYLENSYCGTDTFHTPAYVNTTIGASAGFQCGLFNSIAIMGTKGVPPYTYEILSGSPVNYTAPSQTSNVFSGIPGISGNGYQVRITDKCNNAFTTVVYANTVVNPVTETGAKCVGNNYKASVDSIPNMTYTWTGPNGFTHVGTTLSFSPVTVADTGTYKLYIRNGDVTCAADTIYNVQLVSCIPLPINGLELNARWQNDKQALIYWSHTAANKVDNYLVQRSADGITFSTLSVVNVGSGKAYQYIDNQALSRNFYRIKVKEQNGQDWYSLVVGLSKNAQSGIFATVTRNGMGGKQQLQLSNCPAGTADLAIYNMQGSIVHDAVLNATNGTVTQYDLPVGLAPGLYLIKIRIAGQLTTLKWSLTE